MWSCLFLCKKCERLLLYLYCHELSIEFQEPVPASVSLLKNNLWCIFGRDISWSLKMSLGRNWLCLLPLVSLKVLGVIRYFVVPRGPGAGSVVSLCGGSTPISNPNSYKFFLLAVVELEENVSGYPWNSKWFWDDLLNESKREIAVTLLFSNKQHRCAVIDSEGWKEPLKQFEESKLFSLAERAYSAWRV